MSLLHPVKIKKLKKMIEKNLLTMKVFYMTIKNMQIQQKNVKNPKKITLMIFLFASALNFNLFANKISVGVAPLFVSGLGTEIKDSHLKDEVSVAEKNGFDTSVELRRTFGVNVFAAYQLPFFEKIGVQADFSFINANGFEQKIESVSYRYSYRSIELAPLVTYQDEHKLLGWSCFAGPNFSFPVGKLEYKFSFLEDDTNFFKIKTLCSCGITTGATIGINLKNIGIFALAKYTLDFLPLEIEYKNENSEIMTRRCLSLGLGAKYVF